MEPAAAPAVKKPGLLTKKIVGSQTNKFAVKNDAVSKATNKIGGLGGALKK